jgi:hypothetical protein
VGHRRLRSSVLAFGLASILSVLTAVSGIAATTNVTVTPQSLSATSWYFYDDVGEAASVAEDLAHYKFVVGPGTPASGAGSVFFHNDVQGPPTSSQQRWNIATRRYVGTPLSKIDALKFNTFEPAGEAPDAVFLTFDISFGVTPPTGYQGRLSFVPRQNGTVTANTWQDWNAANSGSLLSWSRFSSNGSKWPDNNTNELRTWADITASFPNAKLDNPANPGFGQVLFRSGEPYPTGFTGYLDKVTVDVDGDVTIFDFEPFAAAQDKDDCKNGGWQNLRRADGSPFKNQGDCVSYTNTRK